MTTTDDPDAIALRPTVIGGARQDDDYEVVWRGFPVGRMMKQPDGSHWWWACAVYGLPPTPNDRGPAINYKDCQVRFRLAWARIRPTLTNETIQAATRHAEGLLEQQAAKGAVPNAPEPLRVSAEQSRSAPAAGIEGRIHRVQRRRHRLHHPECIRHRRCNRSRQSGRRPRQLLVGGVGRSYAPPLPGGLANGQADRRRVRLAGNAIRLGRHDGPSHAPDASGMRTGTGAHSTLHGVVFEILCSGPRVSGQNGSPISFDSRSMFR